MRTRRSRKEDPEDAEAAGEIAAVAAAAAFDSAEQSAAADAPGNSAEEPAQDQSADIDRPAPTQTGAEYQSHATDQPTEAQQFVTEDGAAPGQAAEAPATKDATTTATLEEASPKEETNLAAEFDSNPGAEVAAEAAVEAAVKNASEVEAVPLVTNGTDIHDTPAESGTAPATTAAAVELADESTGLDADQSATPTVVAGSPVATSGAGDTASGEPASAAAPPPAADSGAAGATTTTTSTATALDDEAPATASKPEKRKRRSKWDTTVDAQPVPGPPTPASPSVLPPPPAAVEPVAPKPRLRGAARWGPTPADRKILEEAEKARESAAEADGSAPPKKKRRSRWEEAEEPGTELVKLTPGGVPAFIELANGIVVKMPSALTGLPDRSADPAIAAIQDELSDVNRRLATGDLGIPPEHERSPSPEPIYDRNGIRQNTREIRVREKISCRRQDLVEEMIKRDPQYRPPPDYRPSKKWKKVWIPQKEYPGTNFIGLIIGPRGNTQKRMQRETNTKIAIRGRGSVKEGAARDPRNDYGEDEELHVLITGDKQEDVDNATLMLEDLMQPEDEARNEHKRVQLRELAALNGTLKEFEEQPCFLCGGTGHRQYECPNKGGEVFKLPDAIQSQVDQQYQKDVARMGGGEVKDTEKEYGDFLQSLGGGPPGSQPGTLQGGPPGGPAGGYPGPPAGGRGGGAGDLGYSGGGRGGGPTHEGLGFRPRGGRPGDELPDSCKIYVGNLGDNVTDDMMREAFAPFGNVLHCVALKDMATGMPRGFGFVHYGTEDEARRAQEAMQGKNMAGKPLVCRIRNQTPASRPAPRPDAPEEAKLYVSNLPPTMTNDLLRSVFSPFGEVHDARAIGSNQGPCRGFGFVTMASIEAANASINAINGYKMGERTLAVRVAGNNRPGPGGGQGGQPGGSQGGYGGQPGGGPGGPPGSGSMRPTFGGPSQQGSYPGQPMLQGGHGMPPGMPPSPAGAPGQYGAPHQAAGAPGQYGGPPPPGSAPGHPPAPGPYNMPPPGYNTPPPGYNGPPLAYGAPPPGYGAPPPGFGGPPPGYGFPPQGFPGGAQPYGTPPQAAYGGFPPGAPPPGAPAPYGQPPPGYGQPPASYGYPTTSMPPTPQDQQQQQQQQPPLPPEEGAPKQEIKAEAEPERVLSEYERFMAEMGQPLS